MTEKPPLNPIWETALDWLLLIQENPHDPELAAPEPLAGQRPGA